MHNIIANKNPDRFTPAGVLIMGMILFILTLFNILNAARMKKYSTFAVNFLITFINN